MDKTLGQCCSVENALIIVIPKPILSARNLLLPAKQQIPRAILPRFGMTIWIRIHTAPLPDVWAVLELCRIRGSSELMKELRRLRGQDALATAAGRQEPPKPPYFRIF